MNKNMSYYPHDYHAGPKYCLCDRCLSSSNPYYSRRRSQSRGLSGKPDKRYIEGGKDGTEETHVEIAGKYARVRVPMFGEHEGRKIRVLKRGYGYQNACRIRDYAKRHGLQFRMYDGNGRHGMCNRTDGEAFRYVG